MTAGFNIALAADNPRQPEPFGRIGHDPKHPDFELMIQLYHGGEACRAVALEMADSNRAAARNRKDPR